MLSGPRLIIAATFVAVALVFGGGGSPAPIADLVVQIVALVALCAWAVFAPPRSQSAAGFDPWLWTGVALLTAVPLVQLIPLPPFLWHALPGRSTEVSSLGLIGAAGNWYPVSLSPYRTLASLLSLIPPITIVYFVSQLNGPDRTRLLVCVAGLVIVSAIVGVLQVVGGQVFETGFQANRNSTADVLLIGIVSTITLCLLSLQRLRSRAPLLILAAATVFLAFSVVLTGSRAGTALLVICVFIAWALFRPKIRLSRPMLIYATIILVAGVAAVVALRQNVAIERTLQRYDKLADLRPDIWQDALFAAGSYWPIGSGMGTFTTVFPAAERLEVIDTFVINRAHNDYLEFAVEAGIGGCLLIGAALLGIIFRLISILRSGLVRTAAVHAIAGSGMIAILALHSLVDYPMRSLSLAVLGGFAVALLSRIPGQEDRPRGGSDAPVTESRV